MMSRLICAFVLFLGAGLPAGAQPDDPLARVSTVLRLPEVIEVMRLEGLDYGRTLESQLFPGKGGADWTATVAGLYDMPRLTAAFDKRFRAALPAAAVPPILAFFGTERGRRIVSLEISARRALLEPEVQQSARDLLGAMIESKDPKLDRITAFAQANHLVEENVAATMNANVAFYRGLVAGHAKGFEMTEAQILAEVGGQAGSIRSETQDWLFPFLAMAYEPLSEEDVGAYTEFSRTEAGRQLNAALFRAFGGTFAGVSEGLGRAAARYLSGPAL